jgi:hypothetical protein
MRVTMKQGATAPTPCETIANGEVEDYTINIGASVGGGTGNRQAALTMEAAPGIDEVVLFTSLELPENASTWKLEKSTDGLQFATLATGEADGQAEESIFVKTIDSQPVDGMNQYRLTLYDREGSVLATAPAVVNFEHIAVFGLFPNPASGSFSVELSKLEGRQVNLEVFDRFGQLVYQENIPEVKAKFHQIRIDTWQDGMYFVQVTPEGKRSFAKKLMVAH